MVHVHQVKQQPLVVLCGPWSELIESPDAQVESTLLHPEKAKPAKFGCLHRVNCMLIAVTVRQVGV